MAITTTDILTPQVQQTYNERILSTPTPNYIFSIPAMKMTMPKRGGNTLRMSRYDQLPSSPVPLGNTGVTPPPVTPERTDIDIQVQFYGLA